MDGLEIIDFICPRDAILGPQALNRDRSSFVRADNGAPDVPDSLHRLTQVFRGICPREGIPTYDNQHMHARLTEIETHPAPVLSSTFTLNAGQRPLPAALA